MFESIIVVMIILHFKFCFTGGQTSYESHESFARQTGAVPRTDEWKSNLVYLVDCGSSAFGAADRWIVRAKAVKRISLVKRLALPVCAGKNSTVESYKSLIKASYVTHWKAGNGAMRECAVPIGCCRRDSFRFNCGFR